MRRIVYILLATHFYPPIGLTILTILYGYLTGERSQLLLIGITVLLGQFALGWSNDYIDRNRDKIAHRIEKPIITGRVTAQSIKWLSLISLTLSIGLGFSFGFIAGSVYAVAMASGFSYNIWLKQTVFSVATYFFSFALLPIFIGLCGQTPSLPAMWLIVGFGLLGVGMHFQNVIPDFHYDALTGIKGFVHYFSQPYALLVGTLFILLSAGCMTLTAHTLPLLYIGLICLVITVVVFAILMYRKSYSNALYASKAVTFSAILLTLAAANPY